MEKRYDFIERILFLIRKDLSEKLPIEDTLDNMFKKSKPIIDNIYEIREE